MECVPAVRLEVGSRAAVAALRETGLPELVPSITNCTVPVGVTPIPETVAVKVTEDPYAEGLLDEETVVAEDPSFTI
jgi:hypothetical protein